MLGAVITPLPLSVKQADLTLIAEVQHGKEQGKSVYINTRWVRDNCVLLFSGEDHDSSLALMQNELKDCDNIHSVIASWIDETSILTLSMEEVAEFNQLYEISKDPRLMGLLASDQYDNDTTIAEVILLNGLDLLMNVSRRTLGGK